MSNIYTEHTRLYFRPNTSASRNEIELLLERMLGERGSYWVPVWYELVWPSHVDFQYGSGKGAGPYFLDLEEFSLFEQCWIRLADEGADQDVIFEWSLEEERAGHDGRYSRRHCLYAFDEVHVVAQPERRRIWLPEKLSWETVSNGFRASFVGKYLALNERSDMDIGPCARLQNTERRVNGFMTPSTPNHGNRAPTFVDVPETLVNLIAGGQKSLERVDLLYQGRVVHRAEWHVDEEEFRGIYWLQRCADHWDNCVDEEFVRLRKTKKV